MQLKERDMLGDLEELQLANHIEITSEGII